MRASKFEMKVGRIYCFTKKARKLLATQAKKLNWPETFPIRIHDTSRAKTYTFDLHIVVLEVYDITVFGPDKDWRKIKALLPDGEIGILSVCLTEWQEVINPQDIE